jgi:signal peptidase II
MSRKWIFPVIAVIVLVLDQISKEWIRSNILPGGSILEIGPLSIIHAQNTGSAFSLFTGQTLMLSIINIIGLIAILIFFGYIPRSSTLGNLALGLVFGGALGNLVDRLRLGHVTDFIDVRLLYDYHWPAFNVADSAISIGVIALIFFILLGFKKENANSS